MSPSRIPATRASRARRRLVLIAAVGMAGVVALSACAPPGPANPNAGQTPTVGDVSTELTSEDVTVTIMTNTEASDALTKISDAFTKQHPNVTFDIVAEANSNLAANMSRILTRNDPPDVIFMPSIGQFVQDGLIANLDPYFEAYGWDSWSQELLDINRIDTDGQRGSGSLYAVGIGYNVTGIFYNKEIAAEVGMSAPPATFAEFDDYAHKAVDAGYLGLSVAAKDAGTPFLLQEVQTAYGDSDAITAWTAQVPGSSFAQPGMLKAAEKLQQWKGDGVISKDAVSVDYPTMMGDFQAGKALFVPVGDWEAQRLVAAMGDNVGFFLMPTVEAGAKQYAPAFPSNHAIPAAAKHKDEAAYFLNWVHTDETARKLIVDVIGSSPGGPTDLPAPQTDVPLVQETSEAFQKVLAGGGAVDFFANVSQAFTLSTMNPLMQSLMLGSKTPQQFVDEVQAAYESELMK
ncbi:ABC transporter substrate-binding protein [Microbacterium sp. PA5]|uniref:ABC transporter substrate-binding protein n=1 Tax=Microbacterium sp. PA5 TaxID=3416654 RepID=UPI003CF7C4F2